MAILSVIVPVYNEKQTIGEIIRRISAIAVDKEIIIVNDGSTDGTEHILAAVREPSIIVVNHSTNRGKGAAFLTGLAQATGEYVVIQDADLEYNPQAFPQLLGQLQHNGVDLALGARFLDGHQGLFVHRLGNKFLTALLNFLFCSHLNDYATCYKLARKKTLEQLHLTATGFDIDVEIVCNALKRKMKLVEVPVDYSPRTYKEGKKIRWNDGLWALFYMFKYRFVD